MKKLLLSLLLLLSINCFAYKQIEITSIKKFATYIEVGITMRFPVPSSLLSGGVPLANASQIVASYGSYTIDSIATTPFVVVTHTETISFIPSTAAAFKAAVIAKYNDIATQLSAIVLKNYDTYVGASWDGATWTTP